MTTRLLLFQRDAVDGELLHCFMADTHISDHGLHLCSLALQQHVQAGNKTAVKISARLVNVVSSA